MISSGLEFFPRDDIFFVGFSIELVLHTIWQGQEFYWNFEETRWILDISPLSMCLACETTIKGLSNSSHINRVPLGSVTCFEEKLHKAAVALR